MAGSPVPLAKSRTCIPERGAANWQMASVTLAPIEADCERHLSEAATRNAEPQFALAVAVRAGATVGVLPLTSSLFLDCVPEVSSARDMIML